MGKVYATDEELFELNIMYSKQVSKCLFFLEVYSDDEETLDNCFDVGGKKCLSLHKLSEGSEYFMMGKGPWTTISFGGLYSERLMKQEKIKCWLTDLPWRIIAIRLAP